MLHRLRRKLCTAALHSAAVQAPVDLVAAGLQVLQAPEPDTKVAMTMQHVDAWQEAAELLGPHTLVQFGAACNGMPDVPARPGRPELVDPKEMPSAKQLGVSLPVLYAHALAHIELNAVGARAWWRNMQSRAGWWVRLNTCVARVRRPVLGPGAAHGQRWAAIAGPILL